MIAGAAIYVQKQVRVLKAEKSDDDMSVVRPVGTHRDNQTSMRLDVFTILRISESRLDVVSHHETMVKTEVSRNFASKAVRQRRHRGCWCQDESLWQVSWMIEDHQPILSKTAERNTN
jgi:hypothetical protein